MVDAPHTGRLPRPTSRGSPPDFDGGRSGSTRLRNPVIQQAGAAPAGAQSYGHAWMATAPSTLDRRARPRASPKHSRARLPDRSCGRSRGRESRRPAAPCRRIRGSHRAASVHRRSCRVFVLGPLRAAETAGLRQSADSLSAEIEPGEAHPSIEDRPGAISPCPSLIVPSQSLSNRLRLALRVVQRIAPSTLPGARPFEREPGEVERRRHYERSWR